MTDHDRQGAAAELSVTANDEFKRSFSTWFWGAIISATLVHFLVFALWPSMSADDVSFNRDEMVTIDIPDEIEIPPPPEAIARPATPVITDAPIDEDITIEDITFDANPVENLPPPPEEVDTDISGAPQYTPYDVRPDYKNKAEMERALSREYPPLLRDAGIGGTTIVWFYIDEQGKVLRTQVHTSSGHKALDDAALKVADVAVFTPALNRDKPVPVWIQLPITFTTR
ncbi:MAG: energy transducer TonB [Gemmatimonadota bacterium]|nr:energy transducer TonB [Gemmatimonadota bacterium]MDE2872227.1 energy transducer TonB [Gemmatimonadota bacterium]